MSPPFLLRFKRDLMLWAEREAALQQGKVQAELDWGRKLEEAERKAYTRHEDLITQLSRSRDKVRERQQRSKSCTFSWWAGLGGSISLAGRC